MITRSIALSARYNKKHYSLTWVIILILFSLVISACKKEESPVEENWYVSLKTVQNQVIDYGKSIEVEVKVMIRFDNIPGIRVKYEILKGGGSVTASEAVTGTDGLAKIRWTLGKESFDQLLKASAYKDNGELIASRELKAYCYIPDAWIKVTMDVNETASTILDLIFNLDEKTTFMIGPNYRVYKQGDRYYKWNVINNALLLNAVDIENDRRGVIYVVTSDSPMGEKADIVKSTDNGNTWTLCTRPYEPSSHDFRISVCNDNSIWAYKYGEPVKFSMDEGITWHNAGNNLSAYGHVDVYRLKDSSLLFLGSNTDLLISFDNGENWDKIDTPYSIYQLYVTENDLVVIGSLGKGYMLYTSADYCRTFNLVAAYQSQGFGSRDTFVNRWKDYYYISIPAFGVLETRNFISMNYFINQDLYDFFIDHNGVLMMKSQDFRAVYYLERTDLIKGTGYPISD